MIRLARFLALVAAAAAIGAPAAVPAHKVHFPQPPVRHSDSLPLHAGSHGQRVADLQWLLGGHRPNVFTKVKPTYKFKPNGAFGARTKHAVAAYKFRIGYPKAGQCRAGATTLTPVAGRLLFDLLEGHRQRPTCWVALAAERVKGTVRPGATKTALAIQKLELSQLGVQEQPDGSNRGPRISVAADGFGPYQASTGAYGAAWCASFAQWALQTVTGHTIPAGYPAYVPSIAAWAQTHNFLQAKPKVGSFVIYLSADLRLVNAFHIGYVVRVTATGIQTIEGNYANGVHEVWRPYASNHMVYVDLPGVA